MPGAPRYRDDLQFALELADIADGMTLAAHTRGEPVAFEDKGDGSPVTEHDRLVEEKLRAVICARHRHDGFLGEETGSVEGSERRWIIDPIDGTASFIRGGRSWATQIALEEDGELVVGVTSAPAIDARWWAAEGHGAFRTTVQERTAVAIQVSKADRLRDATWVCYPRLDRLSAAWRELPDRLLTACAPARPTAHGALMVAAGETDVCLQLQGAPWDYAAFAALVRIAGGGFSYLDGTARIAEGGMDAALFSNGTVHDEVLEILNSAG